MKGLSVIHTHHLDSGYTKKLNGVKTKMGWKTTVSPEIIDRLYDEISNENELYIITLVREPIGRNISAYFHNLDAIFRQDNVHAKLSPEQIMEGFFTRYPHSIPITWFDEEFNKVLGLDIYNHPFPKDEGALILNEGRFRILVMRHDIEDSRKQKYIEQLLDVINVKIVRKNEGINKAYYETYTKFIDEISFSDEYINEMLGSRYARHFFASDEIEYLKNKWRRSLISLPKSQL